MRNDKNDLIQGGFFDRFHEKGLRVPSNHRENKKFTQTEKAAQEAKDEAVKRRAEKNARRAEAARKAGRL